MSQIRPATAEDLPRLVVLLVGGRAFRELAALHGEPLREVVRRLPPKSANQEP